MSARTAITCCAFPRLEYAHTDNNAPNTTNANDSATTAGRLRILGGGTTPASGTDA